MNFEDFRNAFIMSICFSDYFLFYFNSLSSLSIKHIFNKHLKQTLCEHPIYFRRKPDPKLEWSKLVQSHVVSTLNAFNRIDPTDYSNSWCVHSKQAHSFFYLIYQVAFESWIFRKTNCFGSLENISKNQNHVFKSF